MLPTTNSMLLDALRLGSERSWADFDARYRQVLFAFAVKLGLREDDAGEVAQEALVAFVEDFRRGRYDRARGRLRSWLFSITRARIAAQQQRRARQQEWQGVTALGGVAGEDELAELWEAEWRRAMLCAGFRELRTETNIDARTLRAFELLALEERPAGAVAEELGMSTDAVYQARSRTLARLREILGRLESDW